jgi:hypothetical protein
MRGKPIALSLTSLTSLISLALAAPASAQPGSPLPLPDDEVLVDQLVIVGRADADAPWSDAPTEARLGQTPELAVVALGRQGKKAVVLADEELGQLVLGGRVVAAAKRRAWKAAAGEPGEPSMEWRLVEPYGFRATPAANGATTPYYSNVSTEAASFGKWLGYDRIDYFETPIAMPAAAARGASARRISALRAGTDERTAIDRKRQLGTELLGTLRYRVRATWPGGRNAGRNAGRVVETPGATATDTYGILPSVHRVSIRGGDDFLGYLGAYLLVPEVFGSAGGGAQHQTERFTGADCADVMVGALRKSGRRDVPYTNVASLPQFTTLVEPPVVLDDEGRSPAPLTHAQVGDLIRIDYGGALVGHTPRSWDHVAAWWQDRSDPAGPRRGEADGVLDGFDLVIHMGHPRLVIEPLAQQSPATIDVLRWKTPRDRGRSAARK